MPRKTRKQPGTSGGNYPNRTDLSQPVRTPTGLPYGQAQELAQAQQAVPLPQVAPLAKVTEQAQNHTFNPIQLNAPSDRPHEPVTAGLSSGPGPGQEVMESSKGLSDLLSRLVAETGSDVIGQMLDRARQLGL